MSPPKDQPTGYSVRIFMPDGDPDGLRIIEKSHWSGQGYVFNRDSFNKVQDRRGKIGAGVYILWERDETLWTLGNANDLPRAYVGESEDLVKRIENHLRNKEKDYWQNGIVFTSKDGSLNKAHSRYIESRLIKYASPDQCKLENVNNPEPPNLSEIDEADAESFLRDVLLCLPVVGVTFFDQSFVGKRGIEVYIKTNEVDAEGRYAGGQLTVLEGSKARKATTDGAPGSILAKRKELEDANVLVADGAYYKFTRNYRFRTPSAASAAVLGRSSNGWSEWKNARGATLREIQISNETRALAD